ncbi:MAG: HK97 gp10 family phage protein [Methermicoccaceae archaeon]
MIKIYGGQKAYAYLDRLAKGAGLEQALELAGQVVEREAVLKIEEMGAVDTGRLKGSITSRVEGDKAVVGTDVEYAVYVHEGHKTRSGGFVPARPFLRAGLQSARPHIRAIFKRRISG